MTLQVKDVSTVGSDVLNSHKPRAKKAPRKDLAKDQMVDDWRPFSPKLDDDGAGYASLVDAVHSQDIVGGLQELAQRNNADNIKQLRLRAASLVLRDLASMGWNVKAESGLIYIRPSTTTAGPSKDAIRKQLEFGRNDQLGETSTRRFILGLERPGRFSSCRPVTDLIVDGRRLAAQLEPIAKLPKDARAERLRTVCQPYLQLVDGDERDEHTGIRLMDIWRYFRHNWATRYRTAQAQAATFSISSGMQLSPLTR